MLWIYPLGIFLWIAFWVGTGRWRLIRDNRLLAFPFVACQVFMLLNFLLLCQNSRVGTIEYEESRFNFLDSRTWLALTASGTIVVLGAVTYAVAQRGFPTAALQFIAYSFISFLGLMAPVSWIPPQQPACMCALRHLQTVPYLWGMFFTLSGIIVILHDIGIWSAQGKVPVRPDAADKI